LTLQLKNCVFIAKKEKAKGKIPSGYDDVKDYIITAKTEKRKPSNDQCGNMTIEYMT